MRSNVPVAIRLEVYKRDGWQCMAPRLDPGAGTCRTRWGAYIELPPPWPTRWLTLSHVKDQPRMGKRAPDDEWHLVTICWGHTDGDNWEKRHMPEQRAYLAGLASAAETGEAE